MPVNPKQLIRPYWTKARLVRKSTIRLTGALITFSNFMLRAILYILLSLIIIFAVYLVKK